MKVALVITGNDFINICSILASKFDTFKTVHLILDYEILKKKTGVPIENNPEKPHIYSPLLPLFSG